MQTEIAIAAVWSLAASPATPFIVAATAVAAAVYSILGIVVTSEINETIGAINRERETPSS